MVNFAPLLLSAKDYPGPYTVESSKHLPSLGSRYISQNLQVAELPEIAPAFNRDSTLLVIGAGVNLVSIHKTRFSATFFRGPTLMKKIFTLLAIVAMAAMAHAQQTGNIVGTVKDPSGAAIPGVTVSLTNTATAAKRTIATNSEGEYNASSLSVGEYAISAEMAGFQKLNRTGVTLTTASTLNVDLVLRVGSESTTVDVTTQASLLQSQSGVVSSLVDSKQIVDLPLVSRNFTDLVLLTPGAHTGSSTNLTEGAGAYSIRGGANFSVNGSVAAANSYLIDGLYDRNQWLNTLVMVPIVDSIAEYRVMTSNFNAEYGEAAGAVTTVTTKSGTNNIHGSVWEFLRNERGNANNYFLNRAGVARTAYHRNVFGGTVGAPIWKDHTFIFGDYQGIRQSVPTASTVTIPTPAQVAMVQTGNFAALGVQLYNPFNVVAGKRQPFAGNNLAAVLDPAAVKLISLLPAPTSSGNANNYTIAPASALVDDQFDVRLDQNVKKSDRLFLKYSFDRPHQSFPGTVYAAANASIPIGPYLATGGSGYETAVQTQSGTIGYSHVFNPSLLLEAHAGVLRWYADIAPFSQSINSATAVGIPGINYDARSGGLPAITISGFAVLGDNSTYPEDSRVTTFQYDADVIKTAGTHTLKTGVLFLRQRLNGFSSFPVRGAFTFNGQFTSQIGATAAAAALADFAIGAESAANRNILTGEFGMRSFQIAGYAQDSWRVTDRLTLEYGLRYGVTTPPYDVHNHWANLNITTGLLEVAGLNGNGRRLRNTDYNTVAPRFGFAYTLGNSRKTVLRGGAGISYVDVLIGGSQLYKNLPYFFAQTVSTSSTLPPPTTLSAGLPTPVAPDPNNTAAISVGSPTAWDMNLREVGVDQYSLGVQRQLRPDIIAEVSYVGTRSEHLEISNLDLNQARPGPGTAASRRPYNTINPNLVDVTYHTSGGDAHYDSLQAHIEKRLSDGINFGASYTYAKFLTDAGNPNGGGNVMYQDSQCVRCNYGSAPDDYRHTFVFNHEWELPFGTGRKFLNHGFVSYIVGPWNLSGIWTKYSGGHFTVTDANNVSNQSGGGAQRPNRIADGNLPSGKRSITKWFDTSAFVAPAQYTFGNSGTGILVGPGYFNVNLTLERNLLVHDRYNIDLRGEAFNALNHANFDNPAASIGNATAGQISSTEDPRILQVALKITF
jgi:hypothetical protein